MDWDWEELKQEYITTSISYRKLAEKHGAPLGTLMRKGADEGWVELREQFKSEVIAKTIKNESDKQANRLKRILAVSDKLLEAVEKAVDSFQTGELLIDKSALKQLSGTIKDIKEIQSIKSDLDRQEQEARIAKLRREAADEEQKETPTLVVEGLPEEFKV